MFEKCPSLHLIYIFGKSHPIMKGYFNFVHMKNLCLKLGSMFIINCARPFGPRVVLLAVFTHNAFL